MARPVGLPLAPALQQRIVESVVAGNTYEVAAQAAGISRRTIGRYIARGEAADRLVAEWLDATLEPARSALEQLDEPTKLAILEEALPAAERSYWRFWLGLTHARAEAVQRRVASIAEVGFGYEARETQTVEEQRILRGEVVTLTKTTTTVRFVRDWRAEAWWLERMDRAQFGRREAVELTGADGGPVQVEDVAAKKARALEVVDQVAAKRRHRAEQAGAGPGEVAVGEA